MCAPAKREPACHPNESAAFVRLQEGTFEFQESLLAVQAAAVPDETARHALHQTLSTRSLTIAGGTSEVLRNVIGERILGLQRD